MATLDNEALVIFGSYALQDVLATALVVMEYV
jgi:hypothetical protein